MRKNIVRTLQDLELRDTFNYLILFEKRMKLSKWCYIKLTHTQQNKLKIKLKERALGILYPSATELRGSMKEPRHVQQYWFSRNTLVVLGGMQLCPAIF